MVRVVGNIGVFLSVDYPFLFFLSVCVLVGVCLFLRSSPSILISYPNSFIIINLRVIVIKFTIFILFVYCFVYSFQIFFKLFFSFLVLHDLILVRRMTIIIA